MHDGNDLTVLRFPQHKQLQLLLVKTAENSNLLLYKFELYFFKACRITDSEEREREGLMRQGNSLRDRETTPAVGRNQKAFSGSHCRRKSSQHAQHCQQKRRAFFTWSRGSSSAWTDSAAPALLSHLRRLRLLQKQPDLCSAVSLVCSCSVCCRKTHLHLPYKRRAMLVLYN